MLNQLRLKLRQLSRAIVPPIKAPAPQTDIWAWCHISTKYRMEPPKPITTHPDRCGFLCGVMFSIMLVTLRTTVSCNNVSISGTTGYQKDQNDIKRILGINHRTDTLPGDVTMGNTNVLVAEDNDLGGYQRNQE